MGWVDTYLNQPSVKAELGVSQERKFASCNMEVNQAFTLGGDWSNSALLLPELVNGGVRLLVYAGNAGEFFSASISLFLFERRWSCAAPLTAAKLDGTGLSSFCVQWLTYFMLWWRHKIFGRPALLRPARIVVTIWKKVSSPRGFLFAMSLTAIFKTDCAPCNYLIIIILIFLS